MKDIKNYILSYKIKYEQNPLILFLNNSSLDPYKRLSLAPCLAHFAMSFSDLNKFIYRNLEQKDMFQEIINEHTFEDERHATLFIKDMKQLEYNTPNLFVDTLQFLWGSDTIKVRQTTFDLISLLSNRSSFEKYVILESIENNGHIIFKALSYAAEELSLITGKNYIYFGMHHLNLETGHALGKKVEFYSEKIENYRPTLSQKETALYLVDCVYDIFNLFWNNLYDYSNKST
ncbi:hypothetical protein GCL60_14105 [Silvanigrella paludirubra]|uniref:Iron-containing redox enzyme family protein n=1 Tax=Silvanigrella paludirubra TaxID=2499159 RepID=A0A6N6VP72_9BACT|nr:hypothetical protein [Silvanigrella paludirubra]KAB8036968.1 hypothetical protein GCL60_14105 [Silvanigrella paludirubra]